MDVNVNLNAMIFQHEYEDEAAELSLQWPVMTTEGNDCSFDKCNPRGIDINDNHNMGVGDHAHSITDPQVVTSNATIVVHQETTKRKETRTISDLSMQPTSNKRVCKGPRAPQRMFNDKGSCSSSQEKIPLTTNVPRQVEMLEPISMVRRLFKSCSDAARELGINRTKLSRTCRAGGGVINNRYFRYVGSDAAEATSLSITSAITPESSNNLQDLVPFPYPPIAYSDPSTLNVSLNEPVNQYPGCDLSIQLPTASSTPVFSNSSGMMGLVSPAPQPHAGPSFYLSPFSRIAAEPSETIANAANNLSYQQEHEHQQHYRWDIPQYSNNEHPPIQSDLI